MPELPEVETVKRVVGPQIINHSITSISVLNEKVISHPSSKEFEEALVGAQIKSMSRRGKFLDIGLENGENLYIHFRMTGGLLVTPENYPLEKHTHVILKLDDSSEIRYIDQRRFGRLWLLGDEEDTYTGISKLGLEPFDDKLDADFLKVHLADKKKTIKECLLDQSIVTGIGNIYGDEILFETGINPQRKAFTLNDEEWTNLAEKIPEVLNFFIEKNEISNEDYLKGKGKDYRNAPYLKVYGRKGESCLKCNSCLQKIVISGRSSVFCPKCQK